MLSIPVISTACIRAVASATTARTPDEWSSWGCEAPETELAFDCEERDFGDSGEWVACLYSFAVDDVVVGNESCCWCHGGGEDGLWDDDARRRYNANYVVLEVKVRDIVRDKKDDD